MQQFRNIYVTLVRLIKVLTAMSKFHIHNFSIIGSTHKEKKRSQG